MTHTFKTISVIGLGYVGLPTAAMFASRGLHVIGVDTKEEAVARINAGRAHFIEPDLDIVMRAVVTAGNLRAVALPEPADAFLIAVPTPIRPDHTADLSAVEAALASIAPVLKRGDVIIIESTCPVGTTERAARQLAEARPDLTFPDREPEASDILLAYCPERILPGHTLRELIENSRTFGGLDRRSAQAARDLYGLFARGEMRTTTSATAELSKLVENAFRDVNVAFANELSIISETLGLDVWSVIELANLHPRVNILSPGPGVGGHCIPVDPWFIHEALPAQTPLIRMARQVNDGKPLHIVERVAAVAERYRAPTIALLGLSYKPNVDDLRESPACVVVRELAKQQLGRMMIVEPHVERLPDELSGLPGVEASSLDEAVAQADIVVILVAHNRFRKLDRGAFGHKVVIDTVGLLASA